MKFMCYPEISMTAYPARSLAFLEEGTRRLGGIEGVGYHGRGVIRSRLGKVWDPIAFRITHWWDAMAQPDQCFRSKTRVGWPFAEAQLRSGTRGWWLLSTEK